MLLARLVLVVAVVVLLERQAVTQRLLLLIQAVGQAAAVRVGLLVQAAVPVLL